MLSATFPGGVRPFFAFFAALCSTSFSATFALSETVLGRSKHNSNNYVPLKKALTAFIKPIHLTRSIWVLVQAGASGPPIQQRPHDRTGLPLGSHLLLLPAAAVSALDQAVLPGR